MRVSAEELAGTHNRRYSQPSKVRIDVWLWIVLLESLQVFMIASSGVFDLGSFAVIPSHIACSTRSATLHRPQ